MTMPFSISRSLNNRSSNIATCLSRSLHTTPTSLLKRKRILHPHPEIHNLTAILTSGATITLRSTSPRASIKLARDSYNNPLWNPNEAGLDDDSGRLRRFEAKFGLGGDMGKVQESEDQVKTKSDVKVAETTQLVFDDTEKLDWNALDASSFDFMDIPDTTAPKKKKEAKKEIKKETPSAAPSKGKEK
ncbi:hypothetical protein BKA69DRAFT_1075047 [Paraphysoderma sedebokerense]|nr:hypothetical protein BKA69DRAFT_1075047 [Paraphysoderma sedebokerense]